MAGALTTHALDTARGTAAAGLTLTLRRISPEPTEATAHTLDENGRATLLDGPALLAGIYEIVFFAGAYQRGLGMELEDPAFLEEVPMRFGIADPEAHYHIPLILSPYGYSTYRGG